MGYTSQCHIVLSFYSRGWGILHSQGQRRRGRTFSPEARLMLWGSELQPSPWVFRLLGPHKKENCKEPVWVWLKSKRHSLCHGEAFLLVQSSVGGRGGDWGGRCFQLPRPSHCTRRHRRSSPRAELSLPLDKRSLWNTWGGGGNKSGLQPNHTLRKVFSTEWADEWMTSWNDQAMTGGSKGKRVCMRSSGLKRTQKAHVPVTAALAYTQMKEMSSSMSPLEIRDHIWSKRSSTVLSDSSSWRRQWSGAGFLFLKWDIFLMNHPNEQHRDESGAGAEPSHETGDTTGSTGGESRLWLTALTAPHFHILSVEPT